MQRSTSAQFTWRTGSLFPPLPRTTSLDVYDLRAIAFDVRLSISTLAGLVNRGAAKVYLLENDDDEFWLGEIDPAFPRTRAVLDSTMLLGHIVMRYRQQVKGLILYDPNLPDTRNVASTLAGLHAGIVVSPEQAELLRGEPYHLPILDDLRVHRWKTRLQAYTWAYKHLLPECSEAIVAGLHPDIAGSLRSFLVAQGVFTCWLDARRTRSLPLVGRGGERGLFKRILSHFPPGAVHLGWFPSEPFGIRLTSRAALLTLASDHCTNLAVWSSLPYEEKSEAASARKAGGGPAVERAKKDTTYLSFTISDGDNLQYCQHFLLRLWHDPARGSLPLGWTIAPALQQVMPVLAAYYRRTATENDELIAGPSGAAYILPSYFPRSQQTAFLRQTARYMQDMQLTLLQVLDSGGWFSMQFLDPELQKTFSAHLTAHELRGILSGAGCTVPSWHQRAGVPIYQNLGLALDAERALSLVQRSAERGTRFINVYIFAWKVTPGELRQVIERLGEGFTIVTPGRLLELIRQEEHC